MNLSEERGLQHLDFSTWTGLGDYVKEKSKRLPRTLPDSISKERIIGIDLCRIPRDRCQKIVRNKERRIGIELPKEEYETRFRIRGSGDLRLRERREV